MPELDRWLSFCGRIGAKGNAVEIYNKLHKLYTQPHRFYHNFDHIAKCIDEFENARHIAEYPNEDEMALWIHDAIYDIRSKDNEEKSAELSYTISKELGLPESFGQRVYNIILATKHDKMPEYLDAQIVADIDLSILGKPETEFEEYERKIREEYKDVILELSEKAFREKRAKILTQFLKRPCIYHTVLFREKYEAQARINLERSIMQLQKKYNHLSCSS